MAGADEDESAGQWDGAALRPAVSRRPAATFARPSVTETGTLMPNAEWYPAWMRYRKREDNHVFWTDKFNRNSLNILPAEKRWTVFSTFWYLVMQFRFYAVPPAFRFIIAMGWRRLMFAAYGVHKALVLWQCKVDAVLAAKASEERAQVDASVPRAQGNASSSGNIQGSGGNASSNSSSSNSSSSTSSGSRASNGAEASSSSSPNSSSSRISSSNSSQIQGEGSRQPPGFSKTMALRRLHWKNSLLGEVLYLFNVYKTGRVHLLPPEKKPAERPTFFWLF